MIKEKVIETIQKHNLIKNGDKIVIGVSGGPDSICLLHILNDLKETYNIQIYVAHINHMIRKEAVEDEQYVQDMCKTLNIPCYIKKENVAEKSKKEKIGEEEAGRKVRYDFFEEILQKTKSNKIATAHTKNDLSETIIMNLLRGTGINGLKGIEPIRDEKYIRPLIELNREEIEQYCKQKKLNPKEDKTNKENKYTRNKVRNIVIPYIKQEFNPNIIESLYRLSEIVQEESKYFDKIISNVYNNIKIEEQNNLKNEKIEILDLKKFNNLELVIKRRLLIYTINKLTGSINGIQKIHIEDIIKLCSNNIGNKMLSPQKNLIIKIKNKKIYIISKTNLP